FVLSLGKIFDRPSNSNTRCLAKIFSLVKHHKKDFPPRLISRFEIEKLKKVNCPSAILDLLENPSPKLCIQICDYYIKILESPDIADKINHVYTARDKFVAHSELVTEGHNLKITTVKELTEIALE